MTLYAVETLRGELVVAERPKELADQDVDLFGHVQRAHVAVQELDLFVAPFVAMALLEAAY